MSRADRRQLEFTKSAVKDVKALKRAGTWGRVQAAIERDLELLMLPENRDVKPLVGFSPWQRLRVGDYRVIYRNLTRSELATLSSRGDRKIMAGYVIKRIVHRRELHQAAEKLGLIAREETTLRVMRKKK